MRAQASKEIGERFAAIEAGAVDSWSNLWLVEHLWKLSQLIDQTLGRVDDVAIHLNSMSHEAFDIRSKDIPDFVTRLGALRERALTKLKQQETPTTEGA